jgi:protein-disulfide isomerase
MKKIITIVVIILMVLGFAYYLFKISPNTPSSSSTGYNASLDISGAKQLTTFPAFDPQTDRYQGNSNAKNVFVEYADFQCPACAAASEILKQVPAQFPDTVFVYRYFPLVQIHPNSVESAMAAEAAGAQGKYWEMHNILFQKQTDWESVSDPLDLFAQYAQSAGVADINQFKTDITDKKYLPVIEKNNNEALGMGLPGTPSYFFNGHSLQASDLAGLLKEAQPYINK